MKGSERRGSLMTELRFRWLRRRTLVLQGVLSVAKEA